MLKFKRICYLAVFSIFFAGYASAETVLDANPKARPYTANLDIFKGLAGRWKGTSAGGPMEAVFSEERFGQIVGHITYWNDKGFRLIELSSYYEDSGSITYRVKHFNAAFQGKQDKGVSVERRLLKYKKGVAYFENMTVNLKGDKLTIHLNYRGKVIEANYKRVK